jgi:hypothetical protein
LTMLYRSTDRLRRAGAPVKNLPHVPSLSMPPKSVPSYTGTEHLAQLAQFWIERGSQFVAAGVTDQDVKWWRGADLGMYTPFTP